MRITPKENTKYETVTYFYTFGLMLVCFVPFNSKLSSLCISEISFGWLDSDPGWAKKNSFVSHLYVQGAMSNRKKKNKKKICLFLTLRFNSDFPCVTRKIL